MVHGLNLNIVDCIFLVVFAISAFSGFVKGLAREIIHMITWVAALIVASLYSHPLAAMVTHSSGMHAASVSTLPSVGTAAASSVSYAAIGISYAVLFIATMLMGSLVGYFITLAIEGVGISIGNRLFGAVFGLIKAGIIILVMIFLFQLTPLSKQLFWRQSIIVQAYQPIVLQLSHYVSPSLANLKMQLNNTMNSVSSGINKISSSPETIKNLIGS